MPMRPIFWHMYVEWVFTAHEKSACKNLSMQPS